MKNIVHINIFKKGGRYSCHPQLSEDHFYELSRWVKDENLLFDSPSSMTDSEIIISFDEECQKLPELLNRFESYGLKPVPRMLLLGADSDTEFAYKINRKFEKSDYLKSEYFDFCWGGVNDHFPQDELLNIKSIKSLSKGWATIFATKFGFFPLLCNDEGREILSSCEFKGIEFKEMPFDNPLKAKGRFYAVQSNIKMPECLLPVGIGTEGLNGLKVYLDGPYEPPILQFARKDIEAIGDFDFACTREMVGRDYEINGRLVHGFPHRIIVSVRFLEFIKSMKIKHEATPVVLVDNHLADR